MCERFNGHPGVLCLVRKANDFPQEGVIDVCTSTPFQIARWQMTTVLVSQERSYSSVRWFRSMQVLSSKLAYPGYLRNCCTPVLCSDPSVKCRLTTQLLSAMSVLNLQSTGRYTAHSSKRAPFVPARGDRAVSQASCLVRQKAQLRTSNAEFLQKVSIHSACPSSALFRAWLCNASSLAS